MREELVPLINLAFWEDLNHEGDHSSKASIPENAMDTARLLVKDYGILAGVGLAKEIFEYYDSSVEFKSILKDGQEMKPGDVAFEVTGKARTLLSVERIALNFMQRMSGIATLTNEYVKQLEGTNAKLLDTRKTTPGLRYVEKWAVRIGGGHNHRMGLYDMIMLKDNHIDYAGGIAEAIHSTQSYLAENDLDIPVEIETRSMNEVNQVLEIGGVDRIMLDNFTPDEVRNAVVLIDGTYETEASGGITLDTIRSYGETGVDFISSGALTHSYSSKDMSLKAIKRDLNQ